MHLPLTSCTLSTDGLNLAVKMSRIFCSPAVCSWAASAAAESALNTSEVDVNDRSAWLEEGVETKNVRLETNRAAWDIAWSVILPSSFNG